MILAAHQPLYLPWLGFFDKMLRSDVFVIMDDLQYVRGNFQNRNRIKVNNGPAWLTVPLVHRSQDERICDKLIEPATNPRQDWRRRTWLSILTHYGKTSPFSQLREELEAAYQRDWRTLLELDLHFIDLFRRWLRVDTPLIMASSLELQGQKTDRILDMCQKVGATRYLSGSGGSCSYLEVAKLESHGIDVIWQKYKHPVYPQRYENIGFIPCLSALDLALNCGEEEAASVFREGGTERTAADPAHRAAAGGGVMNVRVGSSNQDRA